MSFSEEWEQIYISGAHNVLWPWSELISLVHRTKMLSQKPKNLNVLELGCGTGPNIPFFLSLGMNYYGIEGSTSAIDFIRSKFPSLKSQIVPGDFTLEIPLDVTFDLIVDRASVSHNDTLSIKNCLKICKEKLAPGSLFIGLDWFSTQHSEYHNSDCKQIDAHTKIFHSGYFNNIGKVHFSDQEHLFELFKPFSFQFLTHKQETNIIPKNSWNPASWRFVVENIS